MTWLAMNKYPIFPLPLVLLPGGRTRLRIFEQRYLDMVKRTADGSGFIITTIDSKAEKTQMSEIGTWVKIVDFCQLDSGILGIDIEALELVRVSNIEQQEDKLHLGHAEPLEHWTPQNYNEKIGKLSKELQALFDENDEIRLIYEQTRFDQANWVCARWIELLPLNPMQKIFFYQSHSYQQALDLLSTLVLARKN